MSVNATDGVGTTGEVDGPFGGSMARFDAASAMGGVDLFG